MDILEIAKIIQSKKGNLYLVGGAVRDELLGRKVQDEDYCVTGILPEEFLALFPEAKLVGKSFGVFLLEGKEFAMARKESKAGQGHKEFSIEVRKNITIEQDLARRDITINSIAKEVLTGKLVDPFEGRKDLQKGIIKATTEAFKEDPLRVYRVARFAAVLGFKVEQNTLDKMYQMKEELKTLSKERVFHEFEKAIKADRPSIFFEILRQADVLDVHFQEIQNLIGSLQPIKYHPEGDSYNHTMLVLDGCSHMTKDCKLRFSALVHDLGKGTTKKELYPHHHGHDIRGVELTKKLGNRIGVPKKWIEFGMVAAREHMTGGIFGRMTPQKQVTFIERISKTAIGLEGLQLIVKADKEGRKGYQEPEEKKMHREFLKIGKQCMEEISPKYVKEKYGAIQGKQFGEKLHQERIEWMKKHMKECNK